MKLPRQALRHGRTAGGGGATDSEAERLATTPALRFLSLIRGEAVFMRPPVESMDGLWSDHEKAMVQSKLRVAIVGGPETVRRKFSDFLRANEVDEVMFTSDVREHADRLWSFEIAAAAMKEIGGSPPEPEYAGGRPPNSPVLLRRAEAVPSISFVVAKT